jgi:hypothetical protein
VFLIALENFDARRPAVDEQSFDQTELAGTEEWLNGLGKRGSRQDVLTTSCATGNDPEARAANGRSGSRRVGTRVRNWRYDGAYYLLSASQPPPAEVH